MQPLTTFVSISGASGSGQTTLLKNLEKVYKGGRVRTITTRPPRANETAEDYHFVTPAELQNRDDLLWEKEYAGNSYSIAMDDILEAAGQTETGIAFVAITPDYHQTLQEYFQPTSVRIIHVHLPFPDTAELGRRLKERPETGDEEILRRLAESFEYEKAAKHIPGLIHLKPGDAESYLQQVQELITTPP